jgi:predicted phosphodiesterase
MVALRIVLASDSHLSSRSRVFEPNWTAVRRFDASAGADVTVHLGDISLDGAVDPADLLYSHARCQDWPTRIRFLPGNHDVGDNRPGPGIPNEHPLGFEGLVKYRALFGPD